MSRSPLRPRRTRAETDALRAEAIRLSALGLSQRKIAGVLEVTQAAIWKILKQHREASGGYTPRVSRSSSKPSPEPAAPPASVTEPPVPMTVDVASLPPEAFYAHVVDQIEVAIQGARESRQRGSAAGPAAWR